MLRADSRTLTAGKNRRLIGEGCDRLCLLSIA
jgi:hypothetical protein